MFPDVPPGVYAVSVLHDEDGDRELDTNLFGMPTEGWAVSRNLGPSGLSAPSFEDARFRVAAGPHRIRLRLRT